MYPEYEASFTQWKGGAGPCGPRTSASAIETAEGACGETRKDPGDERLYGVADCCRLSGLDRASVLYLTRCGLLTPVRRLEHRRQVRKFGSEDLELLRSARTLQEAGAAPREIVALLRPQSEGSWLLTEMEQEVIRRRYSGRMRKSLDTIGEELGLAKQTVQAINQNGMTKLAKDYLRRQEFLGSRGSEIPLDSEETDPMPGCPRCEKSAQFRRYDGASSPTGSGVSASPDGHEFHRPRSQEDSDVSRHSRTSSQRSVERFETSRINTGTSAMGRQLATSERSV